MRRMGVRFQLFSARRGSRDAAEQKVLHECLLHVHSILASARGLRPLHIRCADMSLRRNRMPTLARRRTACHAMRPSKRYFMSAFCTCIRFWLRRADCVRFTSAARI